jgi:hypothetical protein
MMRFRVLTPMIATLAALPLAVPAHAQRMVTVRGVAFDSLRGAPIPGAHVVVVGMDTAVSTDERGRFAIDSVPAGARTFILRHATLDSIGFRGFSRRYTVGDGEQEIRLALPSFATLWRAVCGGDPPSDSGFLYGTIRHAASRAPVERARLHVSWIVTTYEKTHGIRQRRVVGEALTDADGNYVVCGVPAAHWIKVDADAPPAGGAADVPPTELRVVRRDLFIGPDLASDSTSRGTILGQLVDQDGLPYSEARVMLDDSTEVRSRGDGQFVLRNIRAGTRQLEIMSIGMAPLVTTVDVHPGDSVAARYTLRRLTTLDVVHVMASRRGRQIAEGLEDRRRRGLGMQMDMTVLQAHASFRTVLNEFPGIRVAGNGADYRVFVSDGRGGQCSPEVWVDGARQSVAALTLIIPRNVTAVEYYARATSVPIEFRRTEQRMTCGAILVWTNWALSR